MLQQTPFFYWYNASVCNIQVTLNDEAELSNLEEEPPFPGFLIVETQQAILYGVRNTELLDAFIEHGLSLATRLSIFQTNKNLLNSGLT